MKKKPIKQDPDILALKRVLSTQAEDGTISDGLYEMAERAVLNLERRLKPRKRQK